MAKAKNVRKTATLADLAIEADDERQKNDNDSRYLKKRIGSALAGTRWTSNYRNAIRRSGKLPH